MKISIAMTSYNGEAYIQEQLDSFKRQTLQPDELIISDDGSTDQTVHICHKFAADVKFKVIVLENEQSLGVQKNFEKAMYNCSGDVVFLSDQDDVWYDNKIEEVMKEFNTTDKQLIIHDLEYCDSELNLIGETTIERLRENMKLSFSSYIVGMATAVKKELIDLCLPISNVTSYDSWVHICAELTANKHIFYKSLAFYRRHESNHTASLNVNVPKKTNRLFFLSEKIVKAFRPVDIDALEQQYNLNKDKIHWLKINQKKLYILFSISVDEIKNTMKKLNDLTSIQEERLEILNTHNRAKRFIDCTNFLIKGKYSHFNGLKSFIKDIRILR